MMKAKGQAHVNFSELATITVYMSQNITLFLIYLPTYLNMIKTIMKQAYHQHCTDCRIE